jgi:hypothetical protein
MVQRLSSSAPIRYLTEDEIAGRFLRCGGYCELANGARGTLKSDQQAGRHGVTATGLRPSAEEVFLRDASLCVSVSPSPLILRERILSVPENQMPDMQQGRQMGGVINQSDQLPNPIW